MKNRIAIEELEGKIWRNFLSFNKYGVSNVGIFTQPYCYEDDAELYVVFDKTFDEKIAYQKFSDEIDRMFPDSQISIYSERDSENLNQSIFDNMFFYY